MNWQELLARFEADPTSLSAEELQALEAGLRERAEELANGTLGEAEVAELEAIADHLESVKGVLEAGSDDGDSDGDDDGDAASRASAALARIRGDASGEGAADDAQDGAGTPDDASGDDAADDALTASGTHAGKPASRKAPASAKAAARPNRVSMSKVTVPAGREPRPAEVVDLRAAVLERAFFTSDVRGIRPGSNPTSHRQIAEAFIARHEAFRGKANVREQIPIVQFKREETDRPVLRETDNGMGNDALLRQFVGAEGQWTQSLVASGGICAPSTPLYDFVNISTADRPLRDGLPSVGMPRGGLNWITPLQFTDFDGAVDIWTAANDANPTDPTVKPCLHVDCGDPDDVIIEAITRCLEFGNLGARTFPELVADAIAKTEAWHARFAERRLLELMDPAFKKLANTGELLGAYRDVFAVLKRLRAAYKRRWRTSSDIVLSIALPDYLLPMLSIDLSRQIPGDDVRNVAESILRAEFADIGYQVIWLKDEFVANREFSQVQNAAAALNGWPTTVLARVWDTGGFIHGDDGVLDLGIVRDSTLNSTNDYQMFAESFETVAWRGTEALYVPMNICPSGKTSGTADIDPCTTGS